MPCRRSSGTRMAEPSATRKNTSVSGGNSRNAAPLKKNEPPQRTESTASSDQSRASIRLSFEGMASHLGGRACRLGQRGGYCHPISGKARASGSIPTSHVNRDIGDDCSDHQGTANEGVDG